MNISVTDICENTKMGREFALLGNYETALVYYQGVVQQIHRLLQSVNDPMRKEKWQEVCFGCVATTCCLSVQLSNLLCIST